MGKGTEFNNQLIDSWRSSTSIDEKNALAMEFLKRNKFLCDFYMRKYGEWIYAEIYLQLVRALETYKVGSPMSFLGYFKNKLAWKLPYASTLENSPIKPPPSRFKEDCATYKNIEIVVPDDLDSYMYGSENPEDDD